MLYAHDMGFPTLASFRLNEAATLTTGNYTDSSMQGRRIRTWCRSRTTKKDPAADQKKEAITSTRGCCNIHPSFAACLDPSRKT